MAAASRTAPAFRFPVGTELVAVRGNEKAVRGEGAGEVGGGGWLGPAGGPPARNRNNAPVAIPSKAMTAAPILPAHQPGDRGWLPPCGAPVEASAAPPSGDESAFEGGCSGGAGRIGDAG